MQRRINVHEEGKKKRRCKEFILPHWKKMKERKTDVRKKE
jgi:hypothetical protein